MKADPHFSSERVSPARWLFPSHGNIAQTKSNQQLLDLGEAKQVRRLVPATIRALGVTEVNNEGPGI